MTLHANIRFMRTGTRLTTTEERARRPAPLAPARAAGHFERPTMPSRIAIVSADTMGSVHWPANEHAQRAARYVMPLIRDGPTAYIDNADVRMMALTVDSAVLPFVISDEKPGNADVCSPYSHYVRYTLEEMEKRQNRAAHRVYRPLLLSAAYPLRAFHLDKVVYVNNWLLATNPAPELSATQIGEVTDYLSRRYPDHAIVIRCVNESIHPGFADALRGSRYRMVASRKVYLLDPSSQAHADHDNVKRDERLMRRTGYDVVDSKDFTDADIARVTELYRRLYLNKHSRLNPQFNERFFSLTLKASILSCRAMKRNGQIDAFAAYYRQGEVLTGTAVGYDLGLPVKLGLYRLAMGMLIAEARASGQRVNLSAGAGAFKVLRGAWPNVELEAVYDRHLPYHRRLAWRYLAAGSMLQHPRLARWLRW